MALRAARTARKLRQRIESILAITIVRIARQDNTASRTLRAGMFIETTAARTKIVLPHFWATWYHDGRGSVRARPGGVLAFFLDDSKDPRISSGRPVKTSDVQRLSREEFYRFLGTPGFIVTKEVGPWEGNPFVTRAGGKVATGATGAQVDRFVEREIDAFLLARTAQRRGLRSVGSVFKAKKAVAKLRVN